MDDVEEDLLPVLEPADLAPGWADNDSVLCIGGRTPLDEAVAAMLAGLLKEHGLKARLVERDAIAAGPRVARHEIGLGHCYTSGPPASNAQAHAQPH